MPVVAGMKIFGGKSVVNRESVICFWLRGLCRWCLIHAMLSRGCCRFGSLFQLGSEHYFLLFKQFFACSAVSLALAVLVMLGGREQVRR